MENNYKFSFRRKNVLKITALFFLTLMVNMVAERAQAQSTHKLDGNSQVKVLIDSIKGNFTAMASANTINAEGNFTIKDGSLDELSGFKLKMPVASALGDNLTNDSLSFELTHVMVLPTMRLIHVLGMMEIGGVSSRTELDFSFTVNDDQSISLFGEKSVKLKEYRQDPKFSLAALKDNAELKLNMNLLFKNTQATVVVLNTEQGK